MNKEETIIMQPQNNNKAEQTQNVETSEKKSNGGKKVIATAAAAAFGGGVGGGATYAATEMIHGKEEALETEEPVVAAVEEPQKEQPQEKPQEEVAVEVDEEPEPDYTGSGGADPVTPNPETDETSSADTSEVQVLGVYEAQGDQGQPMQIALLTDGEDVAAVADIDGDGVAEVLLYDENQNGLIDEGEVYDISNENVQMSGYQEAYAVQQQEQMQQEQMQQDPNTFTYNASEEQLDYNNDADQASV